jgi:hypothetical protein
MILGGSSRKTRTSLQNTECRMQIQSSVQSHHLAFPIWRPSLSFHQINLSMHVFMHQSINVSAHGNIVPAHRHPRHRLGSQRARGVSLGAGAGREGRSCKIGHFFWVLLAWVPKNVGKVQNGRHCSDHRAIEVLHWAHACPDRFKKDMHHERGKGPMDPWNGYGTQKLEIEKESSQRSIGRQ